MSRRFSDFLIASSFFISSNCSRSVLAKTGGFAHNWPLAHTKFACDWRQFAYKLYLSGRQLHTNCTRVAASRRQHEQNRTKFACDWQPHRYILHVTGGHSGTIYKRLAGKRCVKGCLYIIIIFFCITKSTSSTMLLIFS